MKIYFVRHGKTEWNLEGRFQGYSGDSKLLEESFHDLESLGEYLATVPFDKIYSSDLQRAHITAERIADLNHYCKSVETKAGFREWNFGRLEGTKIGLFRDIYPKQYHAFKRNVAIFRADMFEGETVSQATSRFITTLSRDRSNDTCRKPRSYSNSLNPNPVRLSTSALTPSRRFRQCICNHFRDR